MVAIKRVPKCSNNACLEKRREEKRREEKNGEIINNASKGLKGPYNPHGA